LIALKRARLRVAMWRAEGYRSPIEEETLAQEQGVAAALARLDPGTEWRTHVAYEFRKPLLEATVAALPTRETVHVLPMYLTDSAFTHALARVKLARFANVRVVPAVDADTLADLSAAHVEA